MTHPEVHELISEKVLKARLAELGQQITLDFAGCEPAVIGVLKGSFVFMADLCRRIDLRLTCDFLGVSSYGDRTKTSGVIRITSDLTQPIEGRHVLLVEDIVDSGLTMQYLLESLRTRRPRSIKVCSLLEKPSRAVVHVPIDYLGFRIEDLFVVGYGLDYKGLYRNLPFLGSLEGVG